MTRAVLLVLCLVALSGPLVSEASVLPALTQSPNLVLALAKLPLALFNIVTAIINALEKVQYVADGNSIFVYLGKDKVYPGAVSLPIPFTCDPAAEAALAGDELQACLICQDDCQYVHNAYGGQCGVSPSNSSAYTCRCIYDSTEATNLGLVPGNTQKTCNVLPNNPITVVTAKGTFISLEYIFAIAIRGRMFADLCIPNPTSSTGFDSVGCSTDCVQNHGLYGGQCGPATPLSPSPYYQQYEKTSTPVFCNCDQQAPATTAATAAPATTAATESPTTVVADN